MRLVFSPYTQDVNLMIALQPLDHMLELDAETIGAGVGTKASDEYAGQCLSRSIRCGVLARTSS